MIQAGQEANDHFEELRFLVFNVAGIKMGVDVQQVSEVLYLQRATERRLALLSLPELIAFGSRTVTYDSPRVLVLRGEEFAFGIVVDQLEEITLVGIDSIQPLPPLLDATITPRAIWGVTAIGEELVLLIDFFGLFDFENEE